MPERALMFAELRGRLADLTATILLPIFLALSGFRTDFTTLGFGVGPRMRRLQSGAERAGTQR